MDLIANVCREMSRNEHIMTYSQIGAAITKGAAVGIKSGVPGGIVIGATLALSLEASESVVNLAKDLMYESKHKHTKRPKP